MDIEDYFAQPDDATNTHRFYRIDVPEELRLPFFEAMDDGAEAFAQFVYQAFPQTRNQRWGVTHTNGTLRPQIAVSLDEDPFGYITAEESLTYPVSGLVADYLSTRKSAVLHYKFWRMVEESVGHNIDPDDWKTFVSWDNTTAYVYRPTEAWKTRYVERMAQLSSEDDE